MFAIYNDNYETVAISAYFSLKEGHFLKTAYATGQSLSISAIDKRVNEEWLSENLRVEVPITLLIDASYATENVAKIRFIGSRGSVDLQL